MIEVIKIPTWRQVQPDGDCIVFRRVEGSNCITMAFPFHEDTQNFDLHVTDVMNIVSALNRLIDVKLLELPKQEEALFPYDK
ncbi:hypothetical protein [Paenibacillus sp. JDR-2]|uniref:hypothetical protein n=1 Tax=Paenibacillus sp. (strain JDR-2) TaxID=324057 RepID=UPI000166A345|nr:hypothetical protein [Paenibacillus sp. JDR-2]ACT00256.1 hypothetical protein Pjdr2_1586 [Paenibacillus sp. JDR-2]